LLDLELSQVDVLAKLDMGVLMSGVCVCMWMSVLKGVRWADKEPRWQLSGGYKVLCRHPSNPSAVGVERAVMCWMSY
jgi:hypothetical protein